MPKIFCNNDKCAHYIHGQACTAPEVFYIDRLCVTFRRRPHKENFANMMRDTAPGYVKPWGGANGRRVTGLQK